MKNKYANRSKISEVEFRELVKLFALNLEATQIAELTGLNRNTVNRFLRAIRERLAEFCEQQPPFSGEIEVDESFFGARRVKGKRGRGAYGKTIVFGVFKRNDKSMDLMLYRKEWSGPAMTSFLSFGRFCAGIFCCIL